MQDALAMLDRGADRDELGEIRAPLVAADVQPHADDAVGAELSASSSMRVIASSRAWYIAWVRTPISWFWFHEACW